MPRKQNSTVLIYLSYFFRSGAKYTIIGSIVSRVREAVRIRNTIALMLATDLASKTEAEIVVKSMTYGRVNVACSKRLAKIMASPVNFEGT
jgi:hypothetical protein